MSKQRLIGCIQGTNLFQDSMGDYWMANAHEIEEGENEGYQHKSLILFGDADVEDFAQQLVELVKANREVES